MKCKLIKNRVEGYRGQMKTDASELELGNMKKYK
jgi:hypothetical protein